MAIAEAAAFEDVALLDAGLLDAGLLDAGLLDAGLLDLALLDAVFAATTGLPVAVLADFAATGFAEAFPFKEAALLDLLGAGAGVSFDLGIFVFVLRRAASNSSFDIPR